MNKVDEAEKLFLEGHACSQAIVGAFCKFGSLSRDDGMKIAAGFAAGMRMGETCGAVTGALMVLGMDACGNDCTTPAGRRRVNLLATEFEKLFIERNKSIRCKTLLGIDISTDEGMAAAESKNLFKTICVDMVRDSADILSQMGIFETRVPRPKR